MRAAQPYRVAYSENAKASIRDLLKRAADAGISDRVSRTLREIEGRLELDPPGGEIRSGICVMRRSLCIVAYTTK
jgi:hypothetical protein